MTGLRALALAAVILIPGDAAAEWQFKPFVGVTFAPRTTFYDFEFAAGSTTAEPGTDTTAAHLAWGGAATLLGEWLGVEAEFARVPGFFEAGDLNRVLSSSVTTLGGNLVVALPRRISQYTLRPYAAAGMGMMRVRSEQTVGIFPLRETLPALSVGGGATGFLTTDFGVNWDLRYFRSVSGKDGDPLVTVGGVTPRLSFWRANMAIVVRY